MTIALAWVAPRLVGAQTAPAPADQPASAPADQPASAPADQPAPTAPAPSDAPATDLPRETAIENPLGRAPAVTGSAFGGYGEITYNAPSNADSVVDFRRFVLFFGHDFTDRIRFYSEVEFEHAVASFDDVGEAEIEQGYLDGLLDKRINLRGGLILMPMGIVNVYHEPPSFHGVDRPDVDEFVIPSTWREPGFGIFGELAEGVRYQLYLVDGFNANGFTADSAIAEGHQEAQLAYAGDAGVIARVDYEPVLGTVIGASAYGGTSGNSLRGSVGYVPIGLFDIDARYKHGGLSARGEVALLVIGDAGALDQALAAGSADQMAAGAVSSRSQGGYAEVAYDVLRWLAPKTEQALDVFTRFDYANTQAAVPAGFMANPAYRRKSEMVGLVYKPIPQIALKLDYRHHWLGAGEQYDELAAAITWLF
ncbi:MAG TPA: hypothetical protein VLX92_20940 [Kofleriaceae bacterium]|nr:hypothetical protein [Kofleriaceae bacterium]